MTESLEETLKQREDRYGKFSDNAQIAQNLKFIMEHSKNWCEMPAYQREALHQISSKISRILTGNEMTYSDSWVDIAGYATRVKMIMDEK